MAQVPNIVIIGAGPTGLGAAWRLAELGHPAWTLLEMSDVPGGLSASVVDSQGFVWDLGGHVLFSHYDYFDQLMDDLLNDAWLSHQRESWIWMRDRFIPYPLQNNIWRLPEEDLGRCLDGLAAVHQQRNSFPPPQNFEEWIMQNYGTGLAEAFMIPYNKKVWAYAPAEMDIVWMKERVSPVELSRILENIALKRDDRGWGPNACFRFPRRGGTGAIWKALASRLPQTQVHYGQNVNDIDLHRQVVHTSSGVSYPYDFVLSTMPLDLLIKKLPDLVEGDNEISRLRHSSTHVIGVGIAGKIPEFLSSKCWMYFPEPAVPFYRVTVFSNYSPHNVPDHTQHWSLLCEVSESPQKPVSRTTIADEVVEALRAIGFLSAPNKIVSQWHTRLEYGYPTPFLGRDGVLQQFDSHLKRHNIWSRGRFGAWKYEVSNQDHSLMQGVEWVDHILAGKEEKTFVCTDAVNR
jgi:protoporphyrinogen oxidase